MKSPEIINVGKIIHICKNTVQVEENIDVNRLSLANSGLKLSDPPHEGDNDLEERVSTPSEPTSWCVFLHMYITPPSLA